MTIQMLYSFFNNRTKMFHYEKYILSRDFYMRSPDKVALDLIGKYFVRKIGEYCLVGKIVEVEAYLGIDDMASHSAKGMTKRNKSLYQSGGVAYVHSMRQHCLLDVVTQESHYPSSVLIRAVEPLEGKDIMHHHRHTDRVEQLTNGPAKFCQSFAIDRHLDGVDMTDLHSDIFVCDGGENISPDMIICSPRIGISQSTDLPLRFALKDNIFVSG